MQADSPPVGLMHILSIILHPFTISVRNNKCSTTSSTVACLMNAWNSDDTCVCIASCMYNWQIFKCFCSFIYFVIKFYFFVVTLSCVMFFFSASSSLPSPKFIQRCNQDSWNTWHSYKFTFALHTIKCFAVS